MNAGDIAIAWDAANARGDWVLQSGNDIATGTPIVSAALVSLFTDARASDDITPPDGSGDRRGWWGSTYTGRPLGSTLWLFERAKKAGNTNLPLAIKRAVEAALQWMLDDKVASAVTVATAWGTPTLITLTVVITEPDGRSTPFQLSWAWTGA